MPPPQIQTQPPAPHHPAVNGPILNFVGCSCLTICSGTKKLHTSLDDAHARTETCPILAIQVKVRAYQSDGQAFEDMFTRIMSKKLPAFRQIKPQGQLGDRKNDGFDDTSGTYFQVFAPEDVWKGDKYGADKLATDLTGLLSHWNQAGQVKSFRYVVNDKYKGLGPQIEQTLRDLRPLYPKLDPLSSFLTGHLEDEFLSLDGFYQDEILGGMAPGITPETVDNDALSAVIHHILHDDGPTPSLAIPMDPSLDRKIECNQLPPAIASHLRSRNAEAASVISTYFRYRAASDKEILGQRFKAFYTAAEILFAGAAEAQSLIFYQILDHITLQKTRPHQNAAMLLMAYYFEACDIYKEPPPLT